ncbi:MAG: peptidyl-prolyl cis-trans isomerase [Syntrophothermus sp.]
MFKYLRVLALVLILFTTISFPQKKDKTIAIVGDVKITETQFKSMFELMPHLSENSENTDSLKNEFLYSLIAEKLWAKEAEQLRIDQLPFVKYAFEPVERLYVKDALFKNEIENKIKIRNEEIIKGLARKGKTLKVNIISSVDSLEILNVYNLLKKNASFDSLLSLRDEFKGQEEPLEITFGQMEDEYVEDTLFSMKPGMFSAPVRTSKGWFIFKLKDKITTTPNNSEQEQIDIKRIIKERRAKILTDKFLSDFLSKSDAKINGIILNDLSNELLNALNLKYKDSISTSYSLFEPELMKLFVTIPQDKINSPIVNFSNNSSTLRQFIHFISMDGFKVSKLSIQNVNGRMKQVIDNFIAQELLYQEGLKRGYLNLPEVQEQLKMWKSSYTAQFLKNRLMDSIEVSDDEAYSKYNSIMNKPDSVKQVNIVEILTNNIEVMEVIIKELEKGKDFKELAAVYNQREWTKKTNGEYGLFPVTLHGEIGKIAADMNIGDLHGPIKVPEGYSLFKLIDKKEPQKTSLASFDKVKDQIKTDIKTSKLENNFDEYTLKLADKYGLKIFKDALESTSVTQINMFTYRLMGFGGRIAAVPYISPFYKWSRKLNTSKVIL